MGGGDCTDANGSAETAGGGGGFRVTINVRRTNGSKLAVEAEVESTVGTLKEVIAGRCDVPAGQQRLVYKGRILKDDRTLGSYGVESDHTIHLVCGAAPSASANPPAGTPTTPGTLAARISTQDQGGTGSPGSTENEGFGDAGLAGSLLPGLGAFGSNGASDLFGIRLPDLDQMQRQLSQNPNIMRDILNMSAVQDIMDPEVVRNFIMNNSQMHEILDRNPDLAHIFNDPNMLQQTLEGTRNPELMREMMRNTDRAMSNIESSPEGFNMLRRIYETVQEPFLNATSMAGDSRNGSRPNPLAALFRNQGTTNAQNRLTSPLTTASETTGLPAPNNCPLPNPWGNAATGNGQTNNVRSMSSSVTDARAPGFIGIGEFGSPDMEQIFGGSQDSSPLIQLLQNPAVAQIVQSVFSTPQYMNQFLNFNSGGQNFLEASIGIREMLQNSELLQQLTSPETLQLFLFFQQSLLSQGWSPAGQDQNLTGSASTGTSNMGLDFLTNMLAGAQGAASMGIRNPSNVPPEERYATQLSQLREMGFYDTQENIQALSATEGNVHAAVDQLLGHLG